jgi:predicted  nucleic acid-binding Zn-ribbon protein
MPPLKTPSAGESEDTDELGLFELGEKAVDEFTMARAAIEAIAEALDTLTAEINAAGSELKTMQNPLVKPDPKKVVALINHSADQMEKYAKKLDQELPKLSEHYASGFQAVARSVAMSKDLGDRGRQEVTGLVKSVVGGQNTLVDVRLQMSHFRTSVATMPRMTTALNRARRHMIESLDRLDRELAVTMNLHQEIERLALATWPDERVESPTDPKQT